MVRQGKSGNCGVARRGVAKRRMARRVVARHGVAKRGGSWRGGVMCGYSWRRRGDSVSGGEITRSGGKGGGVMAWVSLIVDADGGVAVRVDARG